MQHAPNPAGAGHVDITTVLAYKGGVGKSLLAYELAYLLDAVLIDLDWDRGGVTRQWGYRHEDRMRAPLLDAIDKGRTPVPLQGYRKPLLVPSHPDLATNQPAADVMADCLEQWARAWGRPVVVDTHPGGGPTTYGAASAARVVVSPAVLATRELEATEGMLEELADYPLLMVPNKVPRVPPAAELNRLSRMVTKANVPVAPPVSYYSWLERRKIRIAVTSYDPVPARVQPLNDELRVVAEAVKSYARAA
ncbi:ParA family protein [Planomonospora parontospora]|nr:ParA family protein [Planomonospora parontospora]